MKKVVWILILFLPVLVLAGCGGDEPETTTTTVEVIADTTTTVGNCVGAGETFPLVPGSPSCCEGLQGIPTAMINEDGECEQLIGASLCISCGDGICDEGEYSCNCAEDCEEETVTSSTTIDAYGTTATTESTVATSSTTVVSSSTTSL